MDLGLARQDVHRHRREPRDRARDRAAAVRRGRVGAARRARPRRASRRAAEQCARGAAGGPRRSPATSPSRTPASACAPSRGRALRAGRRARQQRRHGALARPRRRPRRGLAGGLGRERDGLACARCAPSCPGMRERGWGRVVNVSSTAGKRPSRYMPEYSVAKAAQLSLSRLYADRCAADGVLVNAICPGPTKSELWVGEGGLADQSAALSGLASADGGARAGGRGPADRAARRGRRDRRRDRLPVLGARLLRRRRRLERRRRHRPGDHLGRAWAERLPRPGVSSPGRRAALAPPAASCGGSRSARRAAARACAATRSRSAPRRHDDVRGERREAGRHGPDVQVVDLDHVRHRPHIASPTSRDVHARRRRLHQHVERLLQQAPRARRDQDARSGG